MKLKNKDFFWIITAIVLLMAAAWSDCRAADEILDSSTVLVSTQSYGTVLGKPRENFVYLDDGRILGVTADRAGGASYKTVWMSADAGTTWTESYQPSLYAGDNEYHLTICAVDTTLFIARNSGLFDDYQVCIFIYAITPADTLIIQDTVCTHPPDIDSSNFGALVSLGGDTLLLLARSGKSAWYSMNATSALSTNLGQTWDWESSPIYAYNTGIRFDIDPGFNVGEAVATIYPAPGGSHYDFYEWTGGYSGSWTTSSDPRWTIASGITTGYRNFASSRGRDSSWHVIYIDRQATNHIYLATLPKDSIATGGWLNETIYSGTIPVDSDKFDEEVALSYSEYDACLRVFYHYWDSDSSYKVMVCKKYDYDNWQLGTDSIVISSGLAFMDEIATGFDVPSAFGSMACLCWKQWDGTTASNYSLMRAVIVDPDAVEYGSEPEPAATTNIVLGKGTHGGVKYGGE
jgi:hypothetical protein